jgi:hypothetical protein
MKTQPLITSLWMLALSLPAAADTLYRCDGPDGVPLFANVPCGTNSTPVQLSEIGVIGSDDGAASLLRRTEAMARIAGIEPPAKRDDAPQGLSFGERMTLRQLEIRRDGLERDVRNRSLSSSYRTNLTKELALVNRRIRELEARR